MYIIFIGLTFLIIISVPIYFSIGITSAVYILYEKLSGIIIAQRMVTGLDSFTLLAIPCFILAGQLMNSSGITKRIFNFAICLVGSIPGGLGMANIVASIIFAGMSGASVADIGGLGAIEIKAMTDEGYDIDFSVGITIASSLVGPIIPPSINIILFASIAGASVGKLFLGGVIPGLVLGLFLMIQVYIVAKKRGYPCHPRPTITKIINSFKEAFLPLGMPVIILGGIVSGIVTPTEAAVIAVLYALFLGIVVYRTLRLKELYKVLYDTVIMTATIGVVIAAASAFGWVLTHARIPHMVGDFILNYTSNRYVFLFIVNVILLIVGCFLDQGASILILTPILLPIAKSLDIDIIHFGILMVLTLQIGLLTPPVGLGVFIGSQVANISITRTFKAVQLFYYSCLAAIIIITLFPFFTLFLPNLLMR